MVFNNSTRGMVRAEMEVSGYVPWGTDVKNPDFGAVARAIGLHGERVERAEDIEPAIKRALEHEGPALVDFVTDPRALAMPPKVAFEQVRGYALAMGKLVFEGNTAELFETLASNIRDVKQLL
jgi:pyruvate dehydrogenase (quinone)